MLSETSDNEDLNFPLSEGLNLFPTDCTLKSVSEAPRREDFHELSDNKTFTRLTDLNFVCCQSPPAWLLWRSWRREPSLARARDRPRPWSGDCRTSPVSPPWPPPPTTTTSPAGASTPGSACCCRTAGRRPLPWRGTNTSPASPPPPPQSPPGPPSRPPREPPSTPTARPSCPDLLLLLTLPHWNTPSPASSPAGGSRSRAPAARWRTAPAAPLRARPRVLPPAPPRPGGSCRTLPARGTSLDSSLLLWRRHYTPAQRLALQTLPGQHQHQIRPSFTLTVQYSDETWTFLSTVQYSTQMRLVLFQQDNSSPVLERRDSKEIGNCHRVGFFSWFTEAQGGLDEPQPGQATSGINSHESHCNVLVLTDDDVVGAGTLPVVTAGGSHTGPGCRTLPPPPTGRSPPGTGTSRPGPSNC